jgi:hypothetical protein
VWLEGIAEKVAGKRIPVAVTVVDEASRVTPNAGSAASSPEPTDQPTRPTEEELRREALADPTVQALLEIFPVEKTKVEEI